MIRDLLAMATESAASRATQTRSKVENLSGDLLGNVKETAIVAKNFAHVTSLIGRYTARASFGKLSIRDRQARLRFFTETVGYYSKKALDTMNVEIKVVGLDRARMEKENFLFVGNHMSYLDILVTSSVLPTVFVTSVDMGETFFLGTMAELGGSIFIERRHRGQIEKDLGVMKETLEAGFNVMIYPEGTSGDGSKLLPFKKSLLMAAVQAKKNILPVCLKYVEINGEPFGPDNCHKVAWYGDMSFAPHFMGLMDLKSVKIELHFLEPIEVTESSTRSELADRAWNMLNETYTASAVEPFADRAVVEKAPMKAGQESVLKAAMESAPASHQRAGGGGPVSDANPVSESNAI